tara:strand:+ start:486 stop:947 length:462 start_codon:yes stop_codon:yes gene_type:complete
MAGTVVADQLEAASTSTLVIKNGVANTPPTVQDSAGTQIGTFCRAWVNFNGTGTVAIRASFNVSSITDNASGDYTVNYTNALPDANYAIVSMGRQSAGTNPNGGYAASVLLSAGTDPTTTATRIWTTSLVASSVASSIVQIVDFPNVNIAVFR